MLDRILGLGALCSVIWLWKRPLSRKLLLTAGLRGITVWSFFWTETAKLLIAFPFAALLAAVVWRMPETCRRDPVPSLAALAVLLGLLPLTGIGRQLFGRYPLPSPERERGILACAAALLIGVIAAVTLARVLYGRYFQKRG